MSSETLTRQELGRLIDGLKETVLTGDRWSSQLSLTGEDPSLGVTVSLAKAVVPGEMTLSVTVVVDLPNDQVSQQAQTTLGSLMGAEPLKIKTGEDDALRRRAEALRLRAFLRERDPDHPEQVFDLTAL